MIPLVDVHSHVSPAQLPEAPAGVVRPHWPCMCHDAGGSRMMLGDTLFRELDARSWDMARRIEDMDRDGVALQVLSPMPELLSYWLSLEEATLLADACNHQISEMVARAPRRFRGLGAVPLQEPERAAADLPRLRRVFGLSGVEIGSNIGGTMLGDRRFDPFWACAEAEGMAVFVHALHPVAAKPIAAPPLYTATALFPVDVAMAAASLIMNGVLDRFPALRIGFSHGGGAIGAMLGRLDSVWARSGGFRGQVSRSPSEQARDFFYDSNVYDAAYLAHLAAQVAPGRIFVGTDYPYEIMQLDPAAFLKGAAIDDAMLDSIAIAAASTFLNEDLRPLVTPGDATAAVTVP